MAEGCDDGGQIAGFVVDDYDLDRHQSSPLVDGSTSASWLSRETATLRARAKALKMASILWWLLRPYMVLTWTLAWAPRAKPSKKSVTSSDCRSPTRRVRTLVSTA